MSIQPSYHTERRFDEFFEVKLPKHLKEGFERFKRVVSYQTEEDDMDDALIQLTLLHYYFGSHASHELK